MYKGYILELSIVHAFSYLRIHVTSVRGFKEPSFTCMSHVNEDSVNPYAHGLKHGKIECTDHTCRV